MWGVFLVLELIPFMIALLMLSSLNTQLLIDVIVLSCQSKPSGIQFLKSLQTGDIAGLSQRSRNFLPVGVNGILLLVLIGVFRFVN